MTVRDEIRSKICTKIKKYIWNMEHHHEIDDILKPMFEEKKLKNYRFFISHKLQQIEIW